MKEKFNLKNKYMIIVIALIFVFVTIFIISKSYALEGFGQFNLTCDKEILSDGDTVNCSITGTVFADNQVSSLETKIELSDNLEFVNFTTNEIWQGNGEDGFIALYTDENKTGTFEVGTFSVKMKEGIVNTNEFIKLNNSYFYDEEFTEQSIEETSLEIKSPQYNSIIYDFSKEYIITNTKDIAAIIKNVNTEGCSVSIYNNGNNTNSGTIIDGAKLIISNGVNVLKEFSIIYIGSNTYNLSKNYIISSVDTLTDIISDIDTINSSLSIKNNQLVLSYNSTCIITYDIININSSLYKINLKDNYIFMNNEINNDILNNISKTDNINLNINDGNLDITYNNEVVKSLKLLNVYSIKYNIDINKGFIYTKGDNNDIISNIQNNVRLSIDNNKLKIMYNDKSIMNLNILSISSNNYKINYDNNYIYTGIDNTIDLLKRNLNIINGDITINNNMLVYKYNENIVEEFNLYYINSSIYKIMNNNIYIKETIDYETFTNNITFNGLNYEIYNTSNNLINSGNIDENFKIKILIDNTEMNTYTIIKEYLEINDLSIKEENKIIYNVAIGTKIEDLLKNIDTSGSIEVVDADGKVLNSNNTIKSHSIIKISLGSSIYEYKVSVLGDLNGNGAIDVGDIAKLYQNVKKENTFDEVDILAGDVVRDEEIIITDVTKLHKYLKGKISNLD